MKYLIWTGMGGLAGKAPSLALANALAESLHTSESRQIEIVRSKDGHIVARYGRLPDSRGQQWYRTVPRCNCTACVKVRP